MTSRSSLGTSGRVVARELVAAPRRDGIVDLDALLEALGACDLLESADRSGWIPRKPRTV